MPISLDEDHDFLPGQDTLNLSPESLYLRRICIKNANKFRSGIRDKMYNFCKIAGDDFKPNLELLYMAAISEEIPSFQTSSDTCYTSLEKRYKEPSQPTSYNNRPRIVRFISNIISLPFRRKNTVDNFIDSSKDFETIQGEYKEFSSYCVAICQQMNGFFISSDQTYQDMSGNDFLNNKFDNPKIRKIIFIQSLKILLNEGLDNLDRFLSDVQKNGFNYQEKLPNKECEAWGLFNNLIKDQVGHIEAKYKKLSNDRGDIFRIFYEKSINMPRIDFNQYINDEKRQYFNLTSEQKKFLININNMVNGFDSAVSDACFHLCNLGYSRVNVYEPAFPNFTDQERINCFAKELQKSLQSKLKEIPASKGMSNLLCQFNFFQILP